MFTLGIDYGTNSVRALIVRASDGKEYGTGVVDYPSGTQGVLLDPRDHNVARQSPADYLYGLQESVARALKQAVAQPDFDVSKVAGIGVDSTGSSPLPVDATNQALGMLPQFQSNPNAQCWLWKDHTSWREAARITELAGEH
ncbi:MAG: ribulokinase, partial [Pararhizobium sp.]